MAGEMERYYRHADFILRRKVQQSSVSLLVLDSGAQGGPKFWTELGCAIMLDKPIIVLVLADAEREARVPDKLRAVADEVIVTPDVQAAALRVRAAIERLRTPTV